MNKKDLLDLGLDEDAVQKIIIMHGKDIEKHKADLEARDNEAKALAAQLEEAGQTIESFKAMDVDAIKAAAEEWKSKAELAQQEAEQKITAVKFDHALQDALREAKARNPKAVKALLDLEKIKLSDEGGLEGLEEQLTAVKTDNDFLFESVAPAEEEDDDDDDPEPRIVSRTANKGILDDPIVSAARKASGLPNF